jgi:hypothetical protein
VKGCANGSHFYLKLAGLMRYTQAGTEVTPPKNSPSVGFGSSVRMPNAIAAGETDQYLSTAQLKVVADWINAGAKND